MVIFLMVKFLYRSILNTLSMFFESNSLNDKNTHLIAHSEMMNDGDIFDIVNMRNFLIYHELLSIVTFLCRYHPLLIGNECVEIFYFLIWKVEH